MLRNLGAIAVLSVLLLGGCHWVLPFDAVSSDRGATEVGAADAVSLDRSGPDAAGDDLAAPDLSACAELPWTISVVAADVGSSNGGVHDTAIALDSSESPHLAYHDMNSEQLIYARREAAGWASFEVKNATHTEAGLGVWHHWVALALDAQGDPHLLYHRTFPCILAYARGTGFPAPQWSITKVVSTAAPMGLALAGGKVGILHTVPGPPSTLSWVSSSEASWLPEVQDIASPGKEAALALDNANVAHVAYHDDGSGTLRYANNAGGSWATSPVDTAGQVGVDPSIAVGQDKTLFVAYHDYGNADLKLATGTPSTGGAFWKLEVVDSAGDVGRYPSLALGPDGAARIAYYDATSGDLKLARQVPTGWQIEVVDQNGDVGLFPSLALDPKGAAHLVYVELDATGSASVKYAHHPCR